MNPFMTDAFLLIMLAFGMLFMLSWFLARLFLGARSITLVKSRSFLFAASVHALLISLLLGIALDAVIRSILTYHPELLAMVVLASALMAVAIIIVVIKVPAESATTFFDRFHDLHSQKHPGRSKRIGLMLSPAMPIARLHGGKAHPEVTLSWMLELGIVCILIVLVMLFSQIRWQDQTLWWPFAFGILASVFGIIATHIARR
ncbi:MAG: hypothetical protein ABIH41_01890 [Nanoarchaeota archaeon]